MGEIAPSLELTFTWAVASPPSVPGARGAAHCPLQLTSLPDAETKITHLATPAR